MVVFAPRVYTELPVQPLRAAILKGEGGPARPTVGAESIPVRDAGELIHVYLARRAGKARELNPRRSAPEVGTSQEPDTIGTDGADPAQGRAFAPKLYGAERLGSCGPAREEAGPARWRRRAQRACGQSRVSTEDRQ